MSFEIEPDVFYCWADLAWHDIRYKSGDIVSFPRFTDHALTEAVRTGRLRYVQVGTKRFYRGDWILEWLENESRINTRTEG